MNYFSDRKDGFMFEFITLNENRDFRRIYRIGKSSVHSLCVVYAVKNRLGVNRVGVTASKKVGNAVKRNRARRVLKAALRDACQNITTGWDFVIVARSRTAVCKSTELIEVLKKQIEALTKPKSNSKPKQKNSDR